MPSTYSSNLLLELMADGENEGLWGEITNENLEILGRAAGGVGGIALAGTTHTLTISQGALSEGQYSTLVLGGSPTGTNTITIQPNTVTRTYLVQNNSGQDAVFTQGSGDNVTVPNGGTGVVFCSGTGSSSSVTDITADFLRGVNNLSDLDDPDTALQNLGLTATATEINKLDGATLDLAAVTATAAELNTLDGITASTAELNKLDGITASTADLNKTTGIEAGADVTDAGNVNPLVDTHLNQSTATADQVLTWDGSDYAWEDAGGGGFAYNAVSGATQSLDLGSFNFFDAGTLTADTTISFTGVPTEAQWTYTADVGVASGYDLEAASYESVSFSIGGEDTSPQGIFFKDDGTKMYIVGSSNGSVYQYSLSTAWNLSTASYDSVSFSVGGQDSIPLGIFFKDDGTKLYMVGNSNDSVYQYSLSTAWDLSTASYDSVSLDVSGQDGVPLVIFFKDDGTKLYMVGNSNDSVYQYSLSTAWDLSTASYDSVSLDVSGQDGSPTGIFFKPDGTKMYLVGAISDTVHQYSLSTAWDLSTASYDSVSLDVSGQDSIPQGIFFKPDGTKMYIVGSSNDSVYQYSTGLSFTTTLPAAVQNPPTETVFGSDRISYTFFTSDGGTNVYLINEEVL